MADQSKHLHSHDSVHFEKWTFDLDGEPQANAKVVGMRIHYNAGTMERTGTTWNVELADGTVVEGAEFVD